MDNPLAENQPYRAKRRRLIGVALAPSAATLGNLLSGVIAILCCLLSIRAPFISMEPRVHPHLASVFPSYLAIGAYLIVLAMIFDALDGRLARMTRQTSEFGAQLDSIADIVSFGVAPAMLYITLLMRLAVQPDAEATVLKLEWRVGLLCALVYISCAAIRLARYNAENIKDESAQKKFSGLPTPGAAAGFVALLLLHEDLAYFPPDLFGVNWAELVRWAMAPLAFGIGLLMVSRLNYLHVVNVYANRERPPTHLIGVVVLLGLGWYSPQILLVVVAYLYIISGLVLHFRRRPIAIESDDEAETELDEPGGA